MKKTQNKKNKRGSKRKLAIAKRGGLLPLLLQLGALGSLAGRGADMVNAVNKAKSTRKQLEKMQHHNHAMEGRGLYLKPQRHFGRPVYKSRKMKTNLEKIMITCHTRPITNIQLQNACQNIKNFGGVFMRDNFPKAALRNESAIVNLDTSKGWHTHWVTYIKHDNRVEYFDSFGNFRPPMELIIIQGKRTRT